MRYILFIINSHSVQLHLDGWIHTKLNSIKFIYISYWPYWRPLPLFFYRVHVNYILVTQTIFISYLYLAENCHINLYLCRRHSSQHFLLILRFIFIIKKLLMLANTTILSKLKLSTQCKKHKLVFWHKTYSFLVKFTKNSENYV